jgi:predicted RNA-binding Zn ribbon-like protein
MNAFGYTGGRPVLDLVGTLSDRGGADVERLGTWADLEAWVHGCGLRVDDLAGGDDDLPRVRALREALHGVVRAGLAGVRPGEADRTAVNAAAAGTGLVPRLGDAGEVRWTGGLDGLLTALARDGLDLVSSGALSTVRQCADEHCTRLFVDSSRGGRRRWCAMMGCGDRAKAAAYRRRHRQARG